MKLFSMFTWKCNWVKVKAVLLWGSYPFKHTILISSTYIVKKYICICKKVSSMRNDRGGYWASKIVFVYESVSVRLCLYFFFSSCFYFIWELENNLTKYQYLQHKYIILIVQTHWNQSFKIIYFSDICRSSKQILFSLLLEYINYNTRPGKFLWHMYLYILGIPKCSIMVGKEGLHAPMYCRAHTARAL